MGTVVLRRVLRREKQARIGPGKAAIRNGPNMVSESTVSDAELSDMERKKPIKKNHIKEFGGRMPRRRPRDKLRTSQGHLGHLGLIYV